MGLEVLGAGDSQLNNSVKNPRIPYSTLLSQVATVDNWIIVSKFPAVLELSNIYMQTCFRLYVITAARMRESQKQQNLKNKVIEKATFHYYGKAILTNNKFKTQAIGLCSIHKVRKLHLFYLISDAKLLKLEQKIKEI